MNGSKRFEFRKTRCHEDVDRMVIYCTSPVKKVVGEAHIRNIIVGDLDSVWEITKDAAGITREFFDDYYNGRNSAIAYELDGVREYRIARPLSDFGVSNAPQSFVYVDR